MSFYHAIITEATGITDPTSLEDIEDVMRNDIFHSTLDWQTREQLLAAAREAVVILKAWEEEPDDNTDEGEALASAGHGTDEDYGSASEMI